ncbi:MAG TPA: hypothetical protein VKX46_18455 [Ktedonobacteraceae bacterium]|nr:hypothetical protein [Ktedonobacteraceae bacterium]
MATVIVILLIVIFNVAALLWGKDSRDSIDSPEWERRGKFWL